MSQEAVGGIVSVNGDVTTLDKIKFGNPQRVCEMIGFAADRLSLGWQILVLKERLSPTMFRFSGNTLRSGGRLGRPLGSVKADVLRPHVHDDMVSTYGAGHVGEMLILAAKKAEIEGPRRIVKLRPNIRHDEDAAPDGQYPMGGGALQWTLTRACRFLIALDISRDGIATAADGATYSLYNGTYEERAAAQRYLQTV